MSDELRRCPECYAYVESMTNHQNWHHTLTRRLRQLEDTIERLTRSGRPVI